MTEFELLSHSVEWRGRLLRAGRETYRYPDGSENTFDKVWHPGAVVVVPFDTQHVWLVRQPREAAGLTACLELPAGKRDRSGESPLALAQRELIEEVGKQARDWQELFGFFPTPGFCDEYMTLFAATGLSDAKGGPAPEEDEHIEIVPWPLADLDRAISTSSDAKTLIGLLWLVRHLAESHDRL